MLPHCVRVWADMWAYCLQAEMLPRVSLAEQHVNLSERCTYNKIYNTWDLCNMQFHYGIFYSIELFHIICEHAKLLFLPSLPTNVYV